MYFKDQLVKPFGSVGNVPVFLCKRLTDLDASYLNVTVLVNNFRGLQGGMEDSRKGS